MSPSPVCAARAAPQCVGAYVPARSTLGIAGTDALDHGIKRPGEVGQIECIDERRCVADLAPAARSHERRSWAPDAGDATHRDHGDTVCGEIVTAPPSERLDGPLVARAHDQDDGTEIRPVDHGHEV